MKDLNKKMTEFLKNNQGSKLFDKEIQSEEDLYLKKKLTI